ncbi:nucleolar protein 56 [Planococcus citri]|uniref:nucleolar protein 56 n=1 Tax=Planococcus citri TaxID=170843 RepID=UPI0031F7850A
MTQLTILFEHAVGYTLFDVVEFEEIGAFLPQVEQSVTDLSRFNKVVKLSAFIPFNTAVDALEAINSISEGIAPESLASFLQMKFLKGSKKSERTLGVADSKLASNISESLGVKCVFTGVVPEIIRGIRFHFHNLVKGLTAKTAAVAQLGLGHSYSRAKVKFNVHRVDNNIIHSIALIDQFDKDINKFSMRMREWYSYHFPELYQIVPDNYLYAKVVQYIGNRKELSEEKLDELEEIVMDSAKAKAILDAARSSMGMDISPIDLENILKFTHRVIGLANCRSSISQYLKNGMSSVAPNLTALLGEQVGARLISHAGSLTNLAKYPASTVQILGAEKALFRALKTRSNTPKYGILFNSSFIGRASTQNKGRISRFLANKCSIASRLDCFAETNVNIFGEKLRQQVEDRLKFFETGDLPPKNIDVMQEAFEEFSEYQKNLKLKSEKKKKKKKQKEIAQEEVEEAADNSNISNGVPKSKKKKRPKSETVEEVENTEEIVEEAPIPKKKKKKHSKNE